MILKEPLRGILQGQQYFDSVSSRVPPSLVSLREQEIVVYGVGESAHWFHEIGMISLGISPLVAVDSNRYGSRWHGLDVLGLREFSSRFSKRRDIFILVCCGSVASFEAIKDSLALLGFRNCWFLAEFYEIHSQLVSSSDAPSVEYQNYSYEIERVFDALSDEISREVFLRFLQLHASGVPVVIPKSPSNEQYFPKDVPLRKGYKHFVSCGAYDGEPIRKLEAEIGSVESIYCFEPEPELFQRLLSFAQEKTPTVGESIRCFRAAVSDFSGNALFMTGSGLGSRLHPAGDLDVEVVFLDQVLADCEVSFVSMDIEGEELKALAGARQLLCEKGPDLGICVYHHPDQIWEIPTFLLELNYNIYFRNYTGYAAETVLYATRDATSQ